MGTPAAYKKAKYEVLAERLTVQDEWNVTPMERGAELEPKAMEFFEKITGKIVEQIGLVSKDGNPNIASSPDGLIKNGKKYTEAVEIKCLSSANHIEAWLENKIPKDYFPQVIQYFIVNEDLQTLYFVLFDPRVTVHPMHVIEVHREEIEEMVASYLAKQEQFLSEVEELADQLIQF